MSVQESRTAHIQIRGALIAAALALALMLPAPAGATSEDTSRPCPPDVPASDFSDRDAIPRAHLCNVDRAAALGIVQGFADGEYKAGVPVTRAQIASMLFRTLDAAGADLPPAGQERFVDVSPGSAHDEAIHRLAAAGVMRGGPLHLDDDHYGPQLLLRRDQTASVLMRAAGFAFHGDPDHFGDWPAGGVVDPALGGDFPDVPATNVHYRLVNAAAQHGLAHGFADGTFRPRGTVRRDQAATLAVRLLDAGDGQVHVWVFFHAAGDEGRDVSALPRTVDRPGVLHATMEELLRGPTAHEDDLGYYSWFSEDTAGMVRSVQIVGGTAFVDFDDFSEIIPNASTAAGSAILMNQLDRTATQFRGVQRACYSFEGDEGAFYEWLQGDSCPHTS